MTNKLPIPMICPVCNTTVRPGSQYCHRCGSDLPPLSMPVPNHPIVRSTPTLVEQGIVPIETNRTACVREVGDVIKVRDVVAMQSGVICNWFSSREGGRGVSVKQEISVGGRIFQRTLRASIVVKTW